MSERPSSKFEPFLAQARRSFSGHRPSLRSAFIALTLGFSTASPANASDDPQRLFAEGKSAYQAGQYARVVPLMRRLIPQLDAMGGARQQPIYPFAAYWLGDSLGKTGDCRAAEPWLRVAVQSMEATRGPDSPLLRPMLVSLAACITGPDRPEAEPAALAERALRLAELSTGATSIDTGQAASLVATVLADQGRTEQALPFQLRAVAIYEARSRPGSRDLAIVQRQTSAALRRSGRDREALPYARRALATMESASNRDDEELLWAQFELGDALAGVGRLRDAIATHEAAVAQCDRRFGPDSMDLAGCLQRLANTYVSAARLEDALTAYRRALRIAERVEGPNGLSVSITLATMAGPLGDLGRAEEAEQHLRRALENRGQRSGRQHPIYADALARLAFVYNSLGRHKEALESARQALSALDAAGLSDSTQRAFAMVALADTMAVLGRDEEVIRLREGVLALYEARGGRGSANAALARIGLAAALSSFGRHDAAIAMADEGAAVLRNIHGPEHTRTAWAELVMGIARGAAGDLDGALRLARSARAAYESKEGPDGTSVLQVDTRMAGWLLTKGRVDEALGILTRTERSAASTRRRDLLWPVQSALGDAYAQQGADALAEFWYLEAIRTLEDERPGWQALGGDLLTGKAGAERRRPYTELASLYVRQGRVAEAQAVMRLLKGDEFARFAPGAVSPGQARVALGEAHTQLDRAREALAPLDAEVFRLQERQRNEAATPQDLARLESLQPQQARQRAEFARAMAAIERSLVSERGGGGRSRLELEQVRSHQNVLADLAAPGEVVAALQYIVTQRSLHVILSTTGRQIARTVSISQNELETLVGEFRRALQDPRMDPRPSGRALYERLVAPVEPELRAAGVTTLMTVPDGQLRYVPMAALFDGREYLVQRYRTPIYTEAAKSRLALPPLTRWSVAAFGVSRGFPEQSFLPLPAVERELAGIVRDDVVPGTAWLNESFTRAALERAIQRPVVHVASHFKFVPGSDDSFLLLGDGTRLTLAQLRTELPRLDGVDLLTLSACETAVGGSVRADGLEVESLGALAQQQGARAVLATLWPVADSSTGELMQSFYRLRQGQGASKAEALRQAQLSLLMGGTTQAAGSSVERGAERVPPAGATRPAAGDRSRPFSHPFYWAPFILMGHWR